MSAPSDTRPAAPVVHAAGAVVWRERDGRLEVVLVHRPRYKDWSWPKGKLDPGEATPAAAVREVAEETGSPIVLGVPLPTLRYRTPEGATKSVHYWAARGPTDDDTAVLSARAPAVRATVEEIDDVVWVSAATATDMLTRRTDARPLSVVQALWAKGRLGTRVVAVGRHGRAQQRSAWRGEEAMRPLTPRGHEQAAALVPVLAAFGVRELVTSPWERCLRTLAPYAERTGLPVRPVDALTEAAHAADPGRAATFLAHHMSAAADSAVITHRPVLATVVEMLDGATRRWSLGRLPGADPYLRPGELLLAHVSGTGGATRVVAVEHHRPTAVVG